MKLRTKRAIHRANTLLNHPLTVIVVLIFLFTYFAIGNAKFQKDNRTLLVNTQRTSDNTNQIIKNLQQAVTDLRNDNARQTRFISCLLALHGEGHLVDGDVSKQCEKMSSRIVLKDVTKQSTTSSQQPAQAPTTTNKQNSPAQPQNTPQQPPAPSKPVEVLGIPVCVPVIKVCVDE